MYTKIKSLLVLFFLAVSPLFADVDYVIFSFDRPMQLYSLLESSERYFTGLGETHIIYRSSTADFENAYGEVKRRFPWANFHRQGSNPQGDFKQLTLASTFSKSSHNDYVFFAVDDIIVTDAVDLNECADALEKSGAYGFYLRLGKNITRCYTLNSATPVPKGKEYNQSYFVWKFKNGQGDWGYPNTVDQTIYRKKDIEYYFRNLDYRNPNTLEANWANHASTSKRGISFLASKNVNLPMNLVNAWNNRCEYHYSVHQLLDFFKNGQKIHIDDFKKVRNESPHMNYKPTFTKR